jgi:hypothetical protein
MRPYLSGEDAYVEVQAITLHDMEADAWGTSGQPHLWIDCNDEHRERYRALVRRRPAEPADGP